MKASFLATTTYAGPAPGIQVWPAPPAFCDREVASMSMHRTIESARRADELGFDWISLSEHHYAPMMLTPNPLVMAGALSQVVKRAKIAILGPLLPLANPVRVAEELAMLDSMSDGRVVVLFLRGTPNEHHTYADVADHSRAMTQEGIDLILKAWTSDQPFSWEGEHFNFPTVSVWPRTRQDPHPQVFGSGNSDESVIFAAQRKLAMGMSFASPNVIRRWVELYRSEAAKAGWTPTPDHILYRGNCHLAESDDQALEDISTRSGTPKAARIEAPPDGPLAYLMRPYFLGGKDTVLSQIRTLRDCGVGIIDISLAMGIGAIDFDRQAVVMQRFADQILPEIRAW